MDFIWLDLQIYRTYGADGGIPTGFNHSAQGCEATLGSVPRVFYPNGVESI
jgi:hypothetical protein